VIAELWRYPRALMLSVLLHVGLLVILFVSLDFDDREILVKQGDRVRTVKAEVVDRQQLETAKRQKAEKLEAEQRQREKARREAEEKRKKIAEENRRKEEQKRLAAEKKRQQAEALKEKQEQERQKKLAEEKRQQEEQKRIAEENKQREAEELRKKQEEEKRLAEEKRLEEEKKQAEAEKRRLAEEEQKRKQQELKAQLEAEESQRRLDSLRDAYRLAIKQRIERYWLRPQESGKMPDCEVRVLQGPGGIILDVTFGDCPGGTNTYRASIENAVYKAEPLPKPGDPSLFERELIILFNPR